MKKIFNGKIIMYLMLFSPIIDIITSVMLYNNINFTLGIFVKCIMIALATIYLLFVEKPKTKYNYLFFLILFIFNILNLINNESVIRSNLFTYFSYLIKYDFTVIMIYFFIKYFRQNKIDIKLLKIPIIILSISIVLSNITNTAFYTYDKYRLGTSSWFSSGNEFGAILSIMYPITIYLFLDRKDSKKIDLIYVIIIAFGMINLGTKVGLLSFFLSSLCYLFFRLINYKNYRLNYSFYAILILLVITGCFFNKLPTVQNVKNKYNQIKTNLVENGNEEDANIKVTGEVILSNRNTYLDFIKHSNYDFFDYMIGKINIKEGYIVIIEMDILDTFYMFGLFGFIILYGLIGYIATKIVIKYLKSIKQGLKYIKINMLLVCLALTFAISCLVGHVIFCPSVSIYFSAICAYMLIYDKFEKEENNKKKILIGAVHMKVGGIEKTLINLLRTINYDKYEVDLFLQLETGEFYNDIPNKVKIITPYPKIVSCFFATESKISKIIKHVLYNKYTAGIWTTNKHYDIAIDYTGYYLFIDYYIAHTESDRKYIWIHQNVNGSLKYDKNFKKNFQNNINKYKKYDKIVCVSNSARKDFNSMFPKYNNKTTVVMNIQDDNIKYKEKVNLNGEYKIVSVGRLCTQKAFHRLIEVHKQLLNKNHKINTYIIGSGELYNELNELIKNNNIEETFKLLGQKSNVYDYLKEADLFVTTSYSEALPTVLLESLMCGIPWVGPNVAGVNDIYNLSPNNSCILTDDNIESIIDGVEKAINGKVNKNFEFNIQKYNKKAIKQFYKLIGD